MAYFWYAEIAILFLSIIMLTIFLYNSGSILGYLNKKIARPKNNHLPKIIMMIFKSLFILISGLIFFGKSDHGREGIFLKSYNLYKILNHVNPEKNFNDELENFGIFNYTYKDRLVVKNTNNNNIIILSLESFDRAYIEPTYSELTPNLSKLKEQWNYIDVNQNIGSNWTSGSLYTLMTGIPSFFGRHHNNIFQNSISSSILSLSDILKEIDYKLIFIIGDAKFSGTRDMLHAFNFNKVVDHTTIGSKKDLDLFNKAKEEIHLQLKKKNKFFLMISSVDTHPPNGNYDARMEKYVDKKTNDLEFMISSTDFLIADLISYLEKIDILNTTDIFILPDHLSRGNQPLINSGSDRGLFLISNREFQNNDMNLNQPLYQIDLPNTILNLCDIKHNGVFISDFIDEEKNTFIAQNINNITSLNIAGFKTLNQMAVSRDYEQYINDTTRFIAHAGGEINNHIYTNSLEALDLNYDRGFRLFELDILKTNDGYYVAAHDWEHWSKITDYNGILPPDRDTFLKYKIYKKYTPLDLQRINKWFGEHNNSILVTDKINEPLRFSKLYKYPNRLMMELFSIDSIKSANKTNIKVLGSHNVFFDLGRNKIEKLKKLNIDNITLSRYNLNNKRINILKELKNNGIKTYLFNINEENDGKVFYNEEFVVKYEMDNIFGIYADYWNFE